jgi:membrane protein DedA with SNARE-associated domain
MIGQLLQWFEGLPPLALYLALAFAAGIENVFPPLPSDTVVAFGSFIAARGRASPVLTYLATLSGNLAGAMFMYWVGSRYGAERVLRRFGSAGGGRERLEAMYGRYGIWAIAVSRFLPGVRAVVPPVAGALRIGAIRALLAMGVASALWYGGITYLAFTAGANFDALQASIKQGQKWVGIVAGAIAVLALGVWWLRRRRRAH